MATKKKKTTKAKHTAGISAAMKKKAQKRKSPKKAAKKVKKVASAKKMVAKKKNLRPAGRPKTANAVKPASARAQSSGPSRRRSAPAFSRETARLSSGGQSGDLQGLSDRETVDSESVDELVEEGNAFEAGIVSGVEDSAGREGKEVRTREVPEDDVPGEYLDED
jgi:hypothetical protein